MGEGGTSDELLHHHALGAKRWVYGGHVDRLDARFRERVAEEFGVGQLDAVVELFGEGTHELGCKRVEPERAGPRGAALGLSGESNNDV